MQLIHDRSWAHQGFTILWGAEALGGLVSPTEVLTVRQLFQLAKAWPAELPHGGGSRVVVAGLDGVLDALSPEDAETWLSDDLRGVLLSFQTEYEGQTALVFWAPDGRARVQMARATEAYVWRCAPPFGTRTLALGRLLWSGAEGDVARLMATADGPVDADGPAWIGIHIRRIS